MTERTRREYLRDFGIAAGGISIAGCLGGGEDGESTPGSTPDSTPTEDPSDSTPEQTDTTEDRTETEEQTDTGSNSETSKDLLGYIPANSEIKDLRQSDAYDPVTGVEHGYPVAIADTVNDEALSVYQEENVIVPSWASFGLDEVEEKVTFRGLGATSVYGLSGDISASDLNDVEEVGEVGSNTLYEWNNGDATRSLIVGDGVVIASTINPANETGRELFSRMMAANEGEITNYTEGDVGGALADIGYEHAFGTRSDGRGVNLEGDQLAQGFLHQFGPDTLDYSTGHVYEDGFESESTQELSNESLRFGAWGTV